LDDLTVELNGPVLW